jgi:riboflavin transporter FmnP
MKKSKKNIMKLSVIGIFGSLAFVLMILSIPIVGPYELDFSEVPVMIGAFAYGPVVGFLIEAIKIFLDVTIGGASKTAYVGELANFIIGLSFVLPASFIYFRRKTRKQAIIGLAVGVLVMTITGALMNAFVLLPLYAELWFGDSLSSLLAVYNFNSLFKFIIFATVPFNLLKGISVSVIILLIYKRVSMIIKAKDSEDFEEIN